MTADLKFDTFAQDTDEVKKLLKELREGLKDFACAICFYSAVRQHCHATKKENSALDQETVLKIRQCADNLASQLGGIEDFSFDELVQKAVNNELTRMVNDGVIPREKASKYRLSVDDLFSEKDIFPFTNTLQSQLPSTFVEQAAHYVNMLQGVGVNALRAASNSQIKRTGKGVAFLQQDTLTVTFDSYDQLKRGLTTGAKKLLDMGSIRLAQINNYVGAAKRLPTDRLSTSVSIPLEEYGKLRGYDVQPRATSTPEEAEAEKKRLNGVYCNIRKEANAELAALFSMSLSWTEASGTGPKRKLRDFADVRILQAKGIKNGYIHMQFTEPLTQYLTQAYIMPYPTNLLAIDERNERAYNIGFKLAYHHGLTNNIKRGTNHIISVKDLLNACGNMPFVEDINQGANRGHWKRLIKEPLEKSLDTLCAKKVITKWEFSNAKGAPLTDAQLDCVNYADFETQYVLFDLPDERL